MNFKDLTGKKFGKLTALKRAPNKLSGSKPRTMWTCLCDCGNTIDVLSDYLKSSECPSCGCEARKNKIEKNRINNIGEKYGRLTIIDIIWEENGSKAVCKCDCGNNYIGMKADIVSGHTKSCGCLQSNRASESNTKDWSGIISDYGVEFICKDHMNNNGQWMWKCKCGICGNYFIALPAKINNGHITSCGCRIQSSGEECVANILKEFDINFDPQHVFDDCKYTYVLRFDFAILINDKVIGIIEYDGKQHFEPIDFFGGIEGFEKTKIRDNIKNKYCKSKNIPMLRIPYTMSINEIKDVIYEYYLSLTTAGCA